MVPVEVAKEPVLWRPPERDLLCGTRGHGQNAVIQELVTALRRRFWRPISVSEAGLKSRLR